MVSRQDIEVHSISNEYIRLETISLGASITKLEIKDRFGSWVDVVLGYEDPMDYISYDGCLGATIGRVAGRIKGAGFELSDSKYRLFANDLGNTLHGGRHGFHEKLFKCTTEDRRLIYTYISPDGEEGFPGELTLSVIYSLCSSALKITYEAKSTKDTLVNITNHSYFNLSGTPCSIGEHVICVNADKYAPIDSQGIPTGEWEDVTHTIFDMRRAGDLKEHMYLPDSASAKEIDQFKYGNGINHPFLLNRSSLPDIDLYCPSSGIRMSVITTLPQAQLYLANYLSERTGKNGLIMKKNDAICIETQYMPDGIHNEKSPDMILHANEAYIAETTYKFTNI